MGSKPAYEDNFVKVFTTDALEGAKLLEPQSVHAIVTSPPYMNLRSYLPADHPDKHLEVGTESSPEAYVERLVEIFRALKPALHDSGTLWLNLSSCYAGSHGTSTITPDVWATDRRTEKKGTSRFPRGFKPKDLVPLAWMVGLALQKDGWYLRADCQWIKGNPMPSSVTDRPTLNHEYILMLTKKPRYYFDMEAVKERSVSDHPSGNGFKRPQQLIRGGRGQDEQWQPTPLRNMRSAWHINCKPYSGSHYATFPIELPLRCIRASSSEYGVCSECLSPYERVLSKASGGTIGKIWHDHSDDDLTGNNKPTGEAAYETYVPPRTVGWQPTCSHEFAERVPATVLDPFIGSGTTAAAARKLGRKTVGFDLDPRNVALIEKRLGYQDALL